MADERPHGETRPRVGAEVRRWRASRGLTLTQLAERTCLNVGYLSQIENGKATPSLDALYEIADALQVPPAWLLLDSTPPPRVVRAVERPRRQGMSGGEISEVDGGTARDLRILEAVGPPGMATGLHTHSGDEHHVVLEGRWRMTQGDRVVDLEPGDYLAWDPTLPHDVECLGPEPGRLLIVYPRHAGRRRGPDATAEP